MLGWFYFTLPSEEQLAEQQRQRVVRDSLAQVELNQNLNPNLDSDIGVPSVRFFDQEVKKYCYMWREGGQFSTEKYLVNKDLENTNN